jgi:hypothetical protein
MLAHHHLHLLDCRQLYRRGIGSLGDNALLTNKCVSAYAAESHVLVILRLRNQ